MAEYKRYMDNPINSQGSNIQQERNHRRSNNTKLSRSKDIKNRLNTVRSKQTFLTDTQSSDYTKLSNECGISSSTNSLAQTIKKLKKQNHDLKQQIIQMKTSQYFNINQDKLKDLIAENQKLKNELIKLRKSLDDSFVERDFLERFNKNLKTQCEQLTRQIVKLTKQNGFKSQDREQKSVKQTDKNARFQDLGKKTERFSVKYIEQMNKSRNSHRSQQKDQNLSYGQKQASKSRAKQQQRLLKKSRSTSRVMENQYFIGKGIRQSYKPRRGKRNQDQ